jgi:hypothetical protein
MRVSRATVVKVCVSALVLLAIAFAGRELGWRAVSEPPSPFIGAVAAIVGQIAWLVGSSTLSRLPRHEGRWLWALLAGKGVLLGLVRLFGMWLWFFGPRF